MGLIFIVVYGESYNHTRVHAPLSNPVRDGRGTVVAMGRVGASSANIFLENSFYFCLLALLVKQRLFLAVKQPYLAKHHEALLFLSSTAIFSHVALLILLLISLHLKKPSAPMNTTSLQLQKIHKHIVSSSLLLLYCSLFFSG